MGHLDTVIQNAVTTHKLPDKIQGHEDGIVSGDTMNVYIPLYTPESDMNDFIKPSVISIQPLV